MKKVHPNNKGTLVSVESKAYQLRMNKNMKRRESTATDLLHEMYLMHSKRLVQLYGDGTPVEPQQILKARGDVIRWADLPENAVIVFVSHEWAGWDHPDPDGVQVKTLCRIISRFEAGGIEKVEMEALHSLIYKHNLITRKEEWIETMKNLYVWFDWLSMPQPTAKISVETLCGFNWVVVLALKGVAVVTGVVGVDTTCDCATTGCATRGDCATTGCATTCDCATTGCVTTGRATTGRATTGRATTGCATTGCAMTGRATIGCATIGCATTFTGTGIDAA